MPDPSSPAAPLAPSIDPAVELPLLLQTAAAAAREIMAVYASAFSAHQKDDGSPVTEADLRADCVIRAGLAQHFAGVPVWSEESDAADGLHATTPRFFLVDPLDGTKEFIKRNGEFTINIALIEHGVPVAAVVQAPALGEVFHAARGVGAFAARADGSGAHALRCQPDAATSVPASLPAATAPLRVLGSRSHGLQQLDAWLATLGRPYTLQSVGSSLKFCRIAQGEADVYPRFGPTSQWDTAAGQCVLEAAGGRVCDLQGRSLRYGRDRDVINPDFIASAPGAI